MDPIRTNRPRLSGPRLALFCSAALLLAGACLTAAADNNVYYKWIDARGLIHYSDRPPPSDGKLLAIETSPYAANRSDAAQRANAASAAAAPKPADKPPVAATDAPPPSLQQKQAVANDVANTRAEQCRAAQERYQSTIRTRRLYREGPDKQPVYLTDVEADAERVNAKREADEACEGVEPQ